ncbi:hypothetical protein GCM10010193_53220 [Kitasatospora atroaurantiaca]
MAQPVPCGAAEAELEAAGAPGGALDFTGGAAGVPDALLHPVRAAIRARAPAPYVLVLPHPCVCTVLPRVVQ